MKNQINVQYSPPSLVRLKLDNCEENLYLMEDYHDGFFQKFTGNNFFIPIVSYDDEVKYLIDFSHWSYVWTDHNIMVTDLQGWTDVNSAKKFILTDPAIHSGCQVFGKTDQGFQGFRRYFLMHSEVCLIKGLSLIYFIFLFCFKYLI